MTFIESVKLIHFEWASWMHTCRDKWNVMKHVTVSFSIQTLRCDKMTQCSLFHLNPLPLLRWPIGFPVGTHKVLRINFWLKWIFYIPHAFVTSRPHQNFPSAVDWYRSEAAWTASQMLLGPDTATWAEREWPGLEWWNWRSHPVGLVTCKSVRWQG